MARSRFRPSPARERWVLAAGLAAAAALSAAALSVLPDPDAAGSAEVARASAEVARAVQRSWSELLRSPDGLIALRPDLISESPAQENSEVPETRSLEPTPGTTAFDALLAESTRLETQTGTVENALSAIDEAIATADDEERLARGLLRKIQLSVKAGDADSGLEAWRAAREKWPPEVALQGVSLRLQCALAAAPLLSENERAGAQSPLAQSFERGTLPLPHAPRLSEAGFPQESALSAFWIERLEKLSDDPGGRALIARGQSRRSWLVLAAHRSLPRDPSSEEWTFDFEHFPVLAARRDRQGATQLRFVNLRATQRRAVQEAVLPEGFRIAFEDEELDVPLVREWTGLPETPWSFRIGHDSPERLRQTHSKRARYGRWGLLALAIGLMFASFFTARMLRRERRLAELKTRFIAGVSHDLRTPLASILLMAENLEDGRIQEEAGLERYYRSIRGEADRLRRLVDDVLDFSRIERGEGAKLNLEETDLASFAEELGRELRDRAERTGTRLRLETSGHERSFVLDRDAVRRALWNLIDNALLHGAGHGGASGQEDGDEIRLGLRASEEELVFEVEDDGPGISASERARVFEPFRQGRAPGTEHAGGTGLGLAIVREIARAHGGTVVALDGQNGRGALFRLTVPENQNVSTG